MYDERKSVLIVDDQESSIVMLTKILSPEYALLTADNGFDAIKTAEENLPDIILLDILMLEMDGYAVLTSLKKNDKTKAIPVIFITSLGSEENEAKGLALGAADYISKPFTPAIVKLRLHNQIKLIEQLRIIENLSMLDQLTDLPNRRYFEERMKSEFGRSLRDKTHLSILLVDLDFFKKYNDTYGHQQGDKALKAVAASFSAALKRTYDFAARWGGEEFVILLPNTDSNGALDIAEQIRKNVEDMVIPAPSGEKTKITASIGVNTKTDESYNDFFQRADKALYEAKNSGRNKVCSSL